MWIAQELVDPTELVGNGVAFNFVADLIWLRNNKVGAGVWDGEGEEEVDCADCEVHSGWMDGWMYIYVFLYFDEGFFGRRAKSILPSFIWRARHE